MIDDVSAAVSWTIENINQYSGNPQRIILGGQSAGAQLSAMAFMDPTVLAKNQHSSAELCGYYGISGVYDINAQFAFEQSYGRPAPVMTAVMGGQANFTGVNADLRVYPERGHSELLFYTLTQNPGQLITDVVDFANQCP
jgi:hypothetical protein